MNALARVPTDAEALGIDPDEGAALDAATLADMLAAGISIKAISSPWSVRRARVCFQPWGDRYFPLVLGEPALIFGIIDGGLIDLAAWLPTTGKIGTRLGAGAAIGQGQIGRDGIGRTNRPLPVFRSPLTWLQRNRKGVVIADWEAAAHVLAGIILKPEDDRHGAELAGRLQVPPPVIITRRAA